jgi:hypothetical protein
MALEHNDLLVPQKSVLVDLLLYVQQQLLPVDVTPGRASTSLRGPAWLAGLLAGLASGGPGCSRLRLSLRYSKA